MKREEINQEANDRIKAEGMDKEWVLCYSDAFTTGAEWMQKTTIEKACGYLYAKTKMSGVEINKFRKAMLEEE